MNYCAPTTWELTRSAFHLHQGDAPGALRRLGLGSDLRGAGQNGRRAVAASPVPRSMKQRLVAGGLRGGKVNGEPERPRIVSTVSVPSASASGAEARGEPKRRSAEGSAADTAATSASQGSETGRPRPVSLTGLELDLSFGDDAAGTQVEEIPGNEVDRSNAATALPGFSPMTAANGQ